MSNQVCYIPILKAKQSECIALGHLKTKIKPLIMPLFELQPRENDRLLSRTIGQIERNWEKRLPLLLDLDKEYLSESPSEAIQNLLKTFRHAYSEGYRFVPVTGVNRGTAYQTALSSIFNPDLGICFRLVNEDLLEPSELNNKLESLKSYFKVDLKLVDLLLDFGTFLPSQSGIIATLAEVIINNIEHINNFHRLILSATAFPANLQGTPQSVNTIPREEWRIWTALKRNTKLKRLPLFSDYTIVYPVFPELDFRFVKIAPKIKYATRNKWLFIRGEKGNWPGFRDVCQLLIQQPQYSGASFSWGDEYINECANSVEDTGNPQRWVTIGINHHLTLVARQCSNPP